MARQKRTPTHEPAYGLISPDLPLVKERFHPVHYPSARMRTLLGPQLTNEVVSRAQATNTANLHLCVEETARYVLGLQGERGNPELIQSVCDLLIHELRISPTNARPYWTQGLASAENTLWHDALTSLVPHQTIIALPQLLGLRASRLHTVLGPQRAQDLAARLWLTIETESQCLHGHTMSRALHIDGPDDQREELAYWCRELFTGASAPTPKATDDDPDDLW